MPQTRLEEARRRVYSAVASDICDALDLPSRTATGDLRPVGSTRLVLGRARTVLVVPVDAPSEPRYGAEISFLDGLEPDDVIVAECRSNEAAFFGELFSTAAVARGAVGALIDGLIRDQERIVATGFPVYARGARPTDCHGRTTIASVDEEVVVAGVRIAGGDLVVADRDGIVVVAPEDAEEVLARAAEKAVKENQARDALRDGATLREAWNRFRVL